MKSKSYLDELIKIKSQTADEHFDPEYFKGKLLHLAKTKENADISIYDVESHSSSNVLALQQLIDLAEHSIKIYTTDIRNEMYANISVMLQLSDWLEADKNRVINFLVKKTIDIKKTGFYNLYKDFKSQITIKQIELKNVDQCKKNAIIVDGKFIKLKYEKDGVEYITINFGSTNEASRLDRLFDKYFSPNQEIVKNSINKYEKTIESILKHDRVGYIAPFFIEKNVSKLMP